MIVLQGASSALAPMLFFLALMSWSGLEVRAFVSVPHMTGEAVELFVSSSKGDIPVGYALRCFEHHPLPELYSVQHHSVCSEGTRALVRIHSRGSCNSYGRAEHGTYSTHSFGQAIY